MNTNKAVFRERLRLARRKKGLTQTVLASKLSVDRSTVVRWESLTGEIPLASTMSVLAKVLGVSAGWLVGVRDEPDAPYWPTPMERKLLERANRRGPEGVEAFVQILDAYEETVARSKRTKT